MEEDEKEVEENGTDVPQEVEGEVQVPRSPERRPVQALF